MRKLASHLTLVVLFYFYAHLVRLGVKMPQAFTKKNVKSVSFQLRSANIEESTVAISKAAISKTTDNPK